MLTTLAPVQGSQDCKRARFREPDRAGMLYAPDQADSDTVNLLEDK